MADFRSSGARFKINDSPSADGGFDATPGQSLVLQLEASPALDVTKCVYSILLKTSGSPALTLPAGGVASPPAGPVTLFIPISTAIYSFVIRAQTNNGEPVFNPATGRADDATVNTFERILVVRGTSAGLRKIIVGERTEYDRVEGWTRAINDIVDAIEAGTGGGGGGGGVTSVAGDEPITSSGGATPTIGILEASSLTRGTQSVAHFELLNAATSTAQPNTIALRDNEGALIGAIGRFDALEIGSARSSFNSERSDTPQIGEYVGSTVTFDGKVGSNFCVCRLDAPSTTFAEPTNFRAGSQLTYVLVQTAPGGQLATFPAFDFAVGLSTSLLATDAGDYDVLKIDVLEISPGVQIFYVWAHVQVGGGG